MGSNEAGTLLAASAEAVFPSFVHCAQAERKKRQRVNIFRFLIALFYSDFYFSKEGKFPFLKAVSKTY